MAGRLRIAVAEKEDVVALDHRRGVDVHVSVRLEQIGPSHTPLVRRIGRVRDAEERTAHDSGS